MDWAALRRGEATNPPKPHQQQRQRQHQQKQSQGSPLRKIFVGNLGAAHGHSRQAIEGAFAAAGVVPERVDAPNEKDYCFVYTPSAAAAAAAVEALHGRQLLGRTLKLQVSDGGAGKGPDFYSGGGRRGSLGDTPDGGGGGVRGQSGARSGGFADAGRRPSVDLQAGGARRFRQRWVLWYGAPTSKGSEEWAPRQVIP
jgi:nucleolin